jgi:hypothetical protein
MTYVASRTTSMEALGTYRHRLVRVGLGGESLRRTILNSIDVLYAIRSLDLGSSPPLCTSSTKLDVIHARSPRYPRRGREPLVMDEELEMGVPCVMELGPYPLSMAALSHTNACWAKSCGIANKTTSNVTPCYRCLVPEREDGCG